MQERLRQLEVVTAAFITDVSLEEVLRRAVKVAAEIIGGRYAAIGMVGPSGKALESFTTYGMDPELEAALGPPPSGHGILGLVLREARPIRLGSSGISGILGDKRGVAVHALCDRNWRRTLWRTRKSPHCWAAGPGS